MCRVERALTKWQCSYIGGVAVFLSINKKEKAGSRIFRCGTVHRQKNLIQPNWNQHFFDGEVSHGEKSTRGRSSLVHIELLHQAADALAGVLRRCPVALLRVRQSDELRQVRHLAQLVRKLVYDLGDI